MSDNILNCVNEVGNAVHFGPLQPFLRTIEPAFHKRASEISFGALISDDRNGTPEPTAFYKKDEQVFPLKVAEDFHPFITSSRLKIMMGISIALIQGTTEATMRLQFGSDLIDVKVQINLNGNYETVILKPDWGLKEVPH